MFTASVRSAVPGLIVALVFGLAACGNGDGNGITPPPNGNGNDNGNNDDDPVATSSVSVDDDFFDPDYITVSPGSTVTWTWEGNVDHNVTWAEGDISNSPSQSTGTFSTSMPDEEGTYVYYCTFHGSPGSGMWGRVLVQ